MAITRKEDVTPQNMEQELNELASRLNMPDLAEHVRFPKYFQLETVRVCNAKCPFCPVDQWDKSTPLMKDDLFERIVSQMAEHKDWIENVCIQRAGEPLIDKKLGKRIRRLKELGIRKVNLSTNASLLTESKAEELLTEGLDEIMLSIDSVHKKAYEAMRVGLNYETTMENIVSFFKVRDRINPEAIVRVRGVSFYDLDNSEHMHELQDWEDFWNEHKKPHDRIYMKKAHNWGNQKEWELIPDYGDIFHPCILMWSTMHITAMGKVALCSMDYDADVLMGDLTSHSIQEVWQGQMFQKMRELHSTGNRNEMEMCRGCKLFDLDNNLEKSEQLQLYEA